jgi:AcrR family transcriptional regulator
MTDQSVSRENQIMEAARELFAKKGYYEVKVDDVAKLCGVAKGTIYLYFKSKADLFVRVLVEGVDDIIDDIRGILASGRDLTRTLSCIFEYYEDSIRKDKYFRRFGEIPRGLLGDLPSDVVYKIHKEIFSRIQELEDEVIDFFSKHIKSSDVNQSDLYQILVAISIAIAKSESDTIKDTALSVILNGIKKEAT